MASPMPVEAPVTSTVPEAMTKPTLSASVGPVELEDAIRTRRTHKAYGAEPVPRETLEELFELARWAPNHNLTNPWRFRVLGPESLAALKQAAGPEAAAKLDRAPTLVVASQVRSDDGSQDEEDLCAVAAAISYVLLARARARPGRLLAHARRAARRRRGARPWASRRASACSGLIHLGPPRQDKEPPERLPPGDYVTFLP